MSACTIAFPNALWTGEMILEWGRQRQARAFAQLRRAGGRVPVRIISHHGKRFLGPDGVAE
jgi:hypothetical protein